MWHFSIKRQRLTAMIIAWWHRKNFLTYCLMPLSWVFQFCSRLRYCYWRYRATRFALPVIIVGNLTVGGTGKTPLVAYIASFLQSKGFNPAIIMHGYGSGLHKMQVERVLPTSNATLVGDEALLQANKNKMPIIVGRSRVRAIHFLTKTCPEVDIVLCDDGLQHYQLDRDIEIALIDGTNRFGNGFCLPVGPLREGIGRLAKVDFIVTNGKALSGEWPMQTQLGATAFAPNNPASQLPLTCFIGKKVHAVAGIAHPMHFFNMLREVGISVIEHPFVDHHLFKATDLEFSDDLPILMTEKDAVKCQTFTQAQIWAVPLEVKMPTEFMEQLLRRIQSGQKAS
ncbi:MAG: tetraacyldisaccharide 4'-kinase [Proteobacteria bacterium]|nr:tetraacyldisaccharide 4'-kinase [Pseudomonadota bacterium]